MSNSQQSPGCESSLATGTPTQCLYSQQYCIQSTHHPYRNHPQLQRQYYLQGWFHSQSHPPRAGSPTSNGGHASGDTTICNNVSLPQHSRPLNPQRSVQSEAASRRPAPHDSSISNVASISKGAPSVAGGANYSRATNTHRTPHPFLPQGLTFNCLKPNLSLRVLVRVRRFRDPARQPVVPTSPRCYRPQNRPILRA